MLENDKYRFLDRSLDNFFAVMDREKLHEPFMEFCARLGYSAVSEYLLDPNSYQIISTKNGIINIAEETPNKIPVTALQTGDVVTVVSGAHGLQSHSLSVNESATQTVTPPSGDAIASIYYRQHLEENTDDTVTLRRYQPLFIANGNEDYVKHGYLCPTAVGHEIVHLAQNLSIPEELLSATEIDWELARIMLDHEIEAYTYQAQLFDDMLFDIGRVTSADMAGVIDSIRRVTLKGNYKANQAFLDKARADEFAQRILPSALKDPVTVP